MFLGNVKDITDNLIKMFSNYPAPWRLCSNGYEKSSIYDFMKLSLGNGLFTAPDSQLESDLNLQSNPDCKLDKYMSKVMDITIQRVLKFWLHPNIIFNNSSRGKRLLEYLSHINKTTSEIIKEKMESMHKENFTQEGKGPYSRKDTSSFLDVIFKSLYESGEYSEADIRDEINTMVFAGSDAAANTLSFLFLMLATFPDIQVRTNCI
ncbi:cytochrome P450 4C1-like [Polistes fuscatus]|uniref:cytochrome P450 4C1-like n=1 Tax=Polistes fuscatus TaxID=30207 RepID=UPI001CA916BE|nr:cytochrome P450 4C1-like [Polistes fuscatus]